MRPLDFNLASRPYSNNTLVWLAYIGLLAAAAGFSYWNVSSFRHYRAELAALDLEQGNMEQEEIDLAARHRKILTEVRKFDRVAISRRTSKANEVIEWRAFSWTRLFNRLEQVLPNNIKMTSIRPIFRGQDRQAATEDPRPSMPVKVEGLARDWDALFELETDLIDSESFGRVLPRSIDKRDNGELAFSIEFTYYPDEVLAGPDEAAVEEAAQAPAQPLEAAETVSKDAEPVDAGADRRKLPAATDEPAEVTDEWMARAAEADATEKQPATTTGTATQRTKQEAARPSNRRALPKVQPEPTDSTDSADEEDKNGTEVEP